MVFIITLLWSISMKINQAALISIPLILCFVFLNALSYPGISPLALISSDTLLAMYLSFLIIALRPRFSNQTQKNLHNKEEKKSNFSFS